MISFKVFLAESQKRIDGIKKIHTEKMAHYILNGEGNHDTHDRGVIRQYNEIYMNTPYEKGMNRAAIASKQVAHRIIDAAASSDPDQIHHKHTEWIVNQWKRGHVQMEDFHGRVRDTLNNFVEHGRKLQNKDINSYKNINDLDSALKPHIAQAEHGDMAAMLDKHPGATLIHKEPGLSVHRLDTKHASTSIRGCSPDNKWCTARDDYQNMFNNYHRDGPLYVVHAKDEASGEVHHYQFHFPSKSFADESDKMHEPSELVKKYPKLKNVKVFGHNEHDGEAALHFLPDDERQHVLNTMAKSDYPEHVLIASKYDGPHLDEILKDHAFKDIETLKNVIGHGHERHLQQLENVPNNIIIRNVIHKSGNNLERLMRITQKIKNENHSGSASDLAYELAIHPGPHIPHLIKFAGYPGIASQMSKHPGPHIDQIAKMYNGFDKRTITDIWSGILSHKNPKHWDMASKHENQSVRYLVAKHGHKFPGPHLDRLVNDPVESVRYEAQHSKRIIDRGENYNG